MQVFGHAISGMFTSRSQLKISRHFCKTSPRPVGKPPGSRERSPPAQTPGSALSTFTIRTAQRLNSCSRPLREPRIDTDFRRLREKLFLSVFDRCSSVAKLSVKMSMTFSADEEFAKQLD